MLLRSSKFFENVFRIIFHFCHLCFHRIHFLLILLIHFVCSHCKLEVMVLLNFGFYINYFLFEFIRFIHFFLYLLHENLFVQLMHRFTSFPIFHLVLLFQLLHLFISVNITLPCLLYCHYSFNFWLAFFFYKLCSFLMIYA